MKKTMFLSFLLSFTVHLSYAQTEVSGRMLSLNGDVMPVATVSVSAIGPANILTLPEKVVADDDGAYTISFAGPGLYSLTVRGVFHKTVSIPLMVYDQDQVDITIYLVPEPYNNGEYFDQQVYLEWIRAFGNFNDYDFFSGEIFRANDDGSISAFIKTELDTIRYQIRGLANGVAVLPGADKYFPRGTDFEAVLYNTSDADSIELRFHPDKRPPYPYLLQNEANSQQVPIRAFVHFHNDKDKFWSTPLQRVRSSRISYQPILKPSDSGVPKDMLHEASTLKYDFLSTKPMSSFRNSVIQDLEENNLHSQQTSALLISYVGLIEQQRSREQYLQRTGRELQELQIHDSIFDRIFNTVDPRNPVWALNNDAPLILLEETGYSSSAVSYAERMIRQHADDMVVRNLVLRLIERRADEFKDVRNMPYYKWIVERYGENNLARRAIITFERMQQEQTR